MVVSYAQNPVFIGRDVYKKHKNSYSYEILQKQYPGRSFRAGVLLIHGRKILLVEQRSTKHFGLPKGGAEGKDLSALDTALRETEEETGIKIMPSFGNNAITHTIANTVLIHDRSDYNSVVVYFIVILKSQPQVRACSREIASHIWADIDTNIFRLQVSVAMKNVFRAVELLDWAKM